MANFTSAFGFQIYIRPVLSAEVDTDSVTGGISAGAGAFIDITPANIIPLTAVVAQGATPAEIDVDSVDIVPLSATEPTIGQLVGLTDASLSTDTSSEDVVTYSDDSGYNQSVATSKSWSISLAGVTDYRDPAYQVMRLAEMNNVAGGLRIKIGRVTPAGENIFGYATLQGFSESVEAGTIVSYTVEAAGYGPLGLTLAA